MTMTRYGPIKLMSGHINIDELMMLLVLSHINRTTRVSNSCLLISKTMTLGYHLCSLSFYLKYCIKFYNIRYQVQLEDVFRIFDKDASGFITRDVLRSILLSLAHPVSGNCTMVNR